MTRPAIVFDSVSKVYSLAHQKTETLKAQMTRFLRGGPFSPPSSDEAFYALRDVSFEIQPGESVGIIGPNGSGKSTSLKILSGVTKPTTGRYELHGKLGALIEVGAGFHPELTGRENVFLNGSILGMKKAEIKKKFDSIVDFADIERFIDTPVKHYSSGMYVRLGFAVAIHNEPDVMLVDEVLAVGDMGFQKKCFKKMEELKDGGRTFILVSHAMSQIQAMCDRAIVLNRGDLLMDAAVIDASNAYLDLSSLGVTQTVGETTSEEQAVATILDCHLLDGDLNPTTHIKLNTRLVFDVILEFRQPVHDPVFVLLIRKGKQRVFSSNTSYLSVETGDAYGRVMARCVLPPLPLGPNYYDVEFYVYSTPQTELYARRNFHECFSIDPPKHLTDIGCSLPPDASERGVIFAHCKWDIAGVKANEE